MRSAMLVAATVLALGACWADAEKSTTAEELLEDGDSVVRAGTLAPDSVLGRDSGAAMDTTSRDTVARPAQVPTSDTAIRVDSAQRDSATRPAATRRP